MERRFTPVVNTVGSVTRVTGVEGGVRWFLGGRRPSHLQAEDPETANSGSNKRRKLGPDYNDDMEIDGNASRDPYPVHRERRPSHASTVESLPAYDEHCSPNYEAHAQALIPLNPASPSSTWQSRLMLSTSGLSIAMSDESLRSLKYCLSWLRWANEHIGRVIHSLQSLLEEWSRPLAGAIEAGHAHDHEKEHYEGVHMDPEQGQLILRTSEERGALNAKIAALKSDVLKTLKDVVDIVSKYAGGALPENARVLVRRHLTSLPQRFRAASTSQPAGSHGDGEVTSAHRVMVLAKEGLDMMAQVSGVVDGTIVSAEEWCDRLGKRRREEREMDNRLAADHPAQEKAVLMDVESVPADNVVGKGLDDGDDQLA